MMTMAFRGATEVVAPPLKTTGIAGVDALLTQYGRQYDTQPTDEQIAEAVRACASLPPDQWMSVRKQLRKVAPDHMKESDLNRLYTTARREEQRQQRVIAPPERYYELDGAMMVVRQTDKGQVERAVANWTAKIVEERTWIDPDEDAQHEVVIELCAATKTKRVQFPTELLGDENALKRKIAAQGGATFTLNRGMTGDLVPAIRALSTDYPHRLGVNSTGWHTIDGKWLYITPSVAVGADGVCSDAPSCEMPTRLHGYALKDGDVQTGICALEAMKDALPQHLAPALIGFSLAPLIHPLLAASISKPALHLIGTTGSGKSEIAALMCNLYGSFSRDEPPAQWGDTVNTVELMGWYAKDALYWADDYKDMYADERTFTRFLQAYSRGMGRGRLTKEAKLRKEKPTRGYLLSTGETILQGEASVLSRMLVLEIPPWEKRDPGGHLLAAAQQQQGNLAVFTRHFVQWVAANADQLRIDLAKLLGETVAAYRKKLVELAKQANTGRMIQNWSVIRLAYWTMETFMNAHGQLEYFPQWQDTIVESIQTIQEQRAGTIFLDTLAQLIHSGQAILDDNLKNPITPGPGQVRVGWWIPKEDYIYLIPDVVYGTVTRLVNISFSKNAIAAQLVEDGVLAVGDIDRHTTRIRTGDRQMRVWKVKASFLQSDEK